MGKQYRKISDLAGMLGHWTVPEGKDEVQGVLEVDDNILSLHTSESFNGYYFDTDEHKIINGFLTDGNEVTLWGCVRLNSTFNMPGLQHFVFSPTYLFVGKQYEERTIEVTKISAVFSGVSRWLAPKCFSIEQLTGDKRGMKVNYEMPTYEKVLCGDRKIYFECETNTKIDADVSCNLEQRIWLTIEYESKKAWTEAYSDLCDFSEFLTLCMGTKSLPHSIRAEDEDGTRIQIFENSHKEIEPKLKRAFLINYADIKDNYTSVIDTWYRKQEQISPVISYFVDAHTAEKVVKSIPRFLRMAQALESFSRKLRKTNLMSPEDHQKRINGLLEQIEEGEDKEWLQKVLETPVINEPSCQQRITALFKELPEGLNLSQKALKTLSFKIVTSRNYYTHFNEALKANILNSNDLFYSSTFMKYVLRVLLASELGVNQDNLILQMRKDSEYCTAVKQLKLQKS